MSEKCRNNNSDNLFTCRRTDVGKHISNIICISKAKKETFSHGEHLFNQKNENIGRDSFAAAESTGMTK